MKPQQSIAALARRIAMNLDLTRHVACTVLLASLSITCAHAHGGRAGDVVITHPFATPTPPGATTGAAYILTLENTGKEPDRLLRVSTPAAQRSELHTMTVDTGNVMRMREVADIQLAPGIPVKMRPGAGLHIMLVGLKQALVEGNSFPMTLEFERGGKTEVKVVVQVPKPRPSEVGSHQH
jgi:periplasmic copper chaperone A